MSKNYKNIALNNLPERELEITGVISAERMGELREKALKKFKESVEISGFRKGMAPENLVAQKVGEMSLLEEAAEIALSEEYPNILNEHKIDAIGRPEINITKIGVGAPLEFKVKTFLLPEVKLADYRKISAEVNKKENKKIEAEEKEVDDVILNLRQNIAHQKMHAEGNLADDDHNHGEIKGEDLPPLDENFAKIVGAEDLNDLNQKIKENIIFEKNLKEKDKKRVEILEEIMTKSEIDLPKILIEGEQEKMIAQLKDDIARNGLSFEEYLKHIKKTEEDIKNEGKPVALKRAKSQVILNTIAKDEKISPKEEDVKKEMEHILSHHKDADRFRVRIYVETFLTNELVFQFLEKQ